MDEEGAHDQGLPASCWKMRMIHALITQAPQDCVQSLLSEKNADASAMYYIQGSMECWTCGQLSDLPTAFELDSEFPECDLDDLLCSLLTGKCTTCKETNVTHSQNLINLALLKYRDCCWLLEWLLDNGADINSHSTLPGNLRTPLMFSFLLTYNKPQYYPVMKLLLDRGANINFCDDSGETVLHKCIEHQDLRTLELLLQPQYGAQVNLRNTAHGYTPLCAAVYLGDEPVVKMLIQAGADCNIPTTDGSTPLMIAIRARDVAIIQFLIQSGKCDIEKMAAAGREPLSPLFACLYYSLPDILKIILDAGANPDRPMGKERNTSLMVCAFLHQQGDIMAEILLKFSKNVNACNMQEYTALHFAAWEGRKGVCEQLLAAGATKDARTQDMNTPLALACHGNFPDVLQMLLECSGPPCNVNNLDKDLDAPIHYCTYNGDASGVKILLDHGADPHVLNRICTTPMWNAAVSSNPMIVLYLIQHNVSLNVESCGIDQHAQVEDVRYMYTTPVTPLYVALCRNEISLKIIQLFLHSDTLLLEELQKQRRKLDFDENGVVKAIDDIFLQQPPTLLRLSRTIIRRACGPDLCHHVDKLELPQTLLDFVTIKTLQDV